MPGQRAWLTLAPERGLGAGGADERRPGGRDADRGHRGGTRRPPRGAPGGAGAGGSRRGVAGGGGGALPGADLSRGVPPRGLGTGGDRDREGPHRPRGAPSDCRRRWTSSGGTVSWCGGRRGRWRGGASCVGRTAGWAGAGWVRRSRHGWASRRRRTPSSQLTRGRGGVGPSPLALGLSNPGGRCPSCRRRPPVPARERVPHEEPYAGLRCSERSDALLHHGLQAFWPTVSARPNIRPGSAPAHTHLPGRTSSRAPAFKRD
jgi:hypothetical protein